MNSQTRPPKPPRTPPIHAAQLQFGSFDGFAEATRGWNLDWRQLDRGRLKADLIRVACPGASILRVAFDRSFLQTGGSPPGMLTFGLLGESVGEIGWYRGRASADNLLVFKSGGEYDSVSQPDFSAHTLSFSEEHLDRVAAHLDLPVTFASYRQGGFALHIDPLAADDLRLRLRELDRAVAGGAQTTAADWIRHELEHEIPARLIRILSTEPAATSLRIDRRRILAAQKARDYIDAHATEPPTIQEVCQAAGVSWRTLNYVFRDIFGVTPKEYLQATRLDGARKQLRQAGPDTTIGDVANRWGFWHMGQFAADYKRQFGELPSETLRRTQPSTQ